MRIRSKTVKTGKNKTGKAMIGWWSGKKECKCGKSNCRRHGGAACVRRTRRLNR